MKELEIDVIDQLSIYDKRINFTFLCRGTSLPFYQRNHYHQHS